MHLFLSTVIEFCCSNMDFSKVFLNFILSIVFVISLVANNSSAMIVPDGHASGIDGNLASALIPLNSAVTKGVQIN
jgi:hypothetical protein